MQHEQAHHQFRRPRPRHDYPTTGSPFQRARSLAVGATAPAPPSPQPRRQRLVALIDDALRIVDEGVDDEGSIVRNNHYSKDDSKDDGNDDGKSLPQ